MGLTQNCSGKNNEEIQKFLTNYKYSTEELQVLSECQQESFYKRSLPIASTLSMMTFQFVKSGVLKPNLRYGAIPKMIGAGFFGYIIGKFSYKKQCIEKLMKLPNSQLAEELRKINNKKMPEITTTTIEPVEKIDEADLSESDTFNMNSSLHIDTDRPSFAINDEDFYRTTGDSYIPNNDIPPYKPSYEDFRKSNRSSFP